MNENYILQHPRCDFQLISWPHYLQPQYVLWSRLLLKELRLILFLLIFRSLFGCPIIPDFESILSHVLRLVSIFLASKVVERCAEGQTVVASVLDY